MEGLMSFVGPALGALFGGAAAGTVAGATALTKLATAAKVGGGIVSTIGSIASANFNADIAEQNQKLAEENAERIRQQAAVHAQEQDVAARGEIGAIIASAGASGLNLGTGSKLLQRRSAEELAAKDRGFTIFRGEMDAHTEEKRAADFATQSSLASQQGVFAGVGGLLDVGTSLVSGASRVNRIRATTIRGNT